MGTAVQENPVNINQVLADNLAQVQVQLQNAEEKERLSLIDYKMVTFSLAGKDYAIDIMKVKEIAKAGRFTYVPNTLPFVLGVYNLRGDIIPIIDLRLFFNIEIEERAPDALENMLILSVGEQVFGIVVDEIDKVVGIQKSTINPPHPLFGDINIKYIQGVAEVANRLYILLDVDKIFNSKATEAEKEEKANQMMARAAAVAPKMSSVKSVAAPKAQQVSDVDFAFVGNALESMKKFTVTPVNTDWAKTRFGEWIKARGKDKSQLQNAEEAEEFLKPFFSPCSNDWWTKDYADSVYKALPDNSAKQIVVWNPGCGKGMETYSLACLLKRRYPEAKIRIYAHDIDLLNVSNAPLMSVPANVANDWYAPYVTKKANGDFTFTSDVKDSIMFEYHDCANTNALPVCDIIFARDLISFLSQTGQEKIVEDFTEKLKGNGIVILGQNESLEKNSKWVPKKAGTIMTFGKQ
ncbi:MAG: chemotaxis protein CheW [Treponema sp.]|nr:chemotaxis protein CheW [Treponema sp.]